MRLIHWIFAVCLFTASFDIALVFDVGATLRLSQVLMVVVVLGGVAKLVQSGTILWPRGGMGLVVWCAAQVIFLSISLAPDIGIPFNVLLFFTIFGVFAVLQLYGGSDYVDSLMKIYLISYVFIAFFGLFQLVSPSLHLGTYLVTEWILRGKIPRINGFCYEPSYFATYVMMGWIMLVDLRASKARIIEGRTWKWLTIIVGLALFLSTSKSAWVIMAVEGMARAMPTAYHKFRRSLAKLGAGDLRVQRPRIRFLIVGLVFVGIGAVGLMAVASIVDLNIFISGTGLNHTAAHSVTERSNRSIDTFKIFLEHPWVGQSLTGVAGRVAELHGHQLISVDDLRKWWGAPVILEVLAASGVMGVIPFLYFFGMITVGNLGLIRDHWPEEQAKWLRALVRALVFEWIMLLADQNLLRVYLWFHVTMVVVVAFNLKHWPRLEKHSKVEVAMA